jgi:hypothetical protein
MSGLGREGNWILRSHTESAKHQTSAQPPSSSLYEASDSGLSGLSTSFATRSSARPDSYIQAFQLRDGQGSGATE